MKRFFAICLILMLLMGLGCAGKPEAVEEPSGWLSGYAAPLLYDNGGVTVSADSLWQSDTLRYSLALTVKNDLSTPVKVSVAGFQADGQDTKFRVPKAKQINAGETVTNVVSFELSGSEHFGELTLVLDIRRPKNTEGLPETERTEPLSVKTPAYGDWLLTQPLPEGTPLAAIQDYLSLAAGEAFQACTIEYLSCEFLMKGRLRLWFSAHNTGELPIETILFLRGVGDERHYDSYGPWLDLEDIPALPAGESAVFSMTVGLKNGEEDAGFCQRYGIRAQADIPALMFQISVEYSDGSGSRSVYAYLFDKTREQAMAVGDTAETPDGRITLDAVTPYSSSGEFAVTLRVDMATMSGDLANELPRKAVLTFGDDIAIHAHSVSVRIEDNDLIVELGFVKVLDGSNKREREPRELPLDLDLGPAGCTLSYGDYVWALDKLPAQ